MGIKCNVCVALGGLIFSCNTVMAGAMYRIDPAQSYIKTYVPSWVPSSYGMFVPWLGGGSWMPRWELQWKLTSFSLSGSFDGAVELSPWVPGVGHFAISQQDYKVDAPISGTFNLPSILSFYQSSGEIVYNASPCGVDPFYPWPGPGWSCMGWSFGIPPSLSGTFYGKTIDIQGGTSGLHLAYIYTFFGETPPPIDPALLPQEYYTYKIVAATVPEPGILPLVFLGIAALYQVKRRKMAS